MNFNPYDFDTTLTLLKAVEKIQPPENFLAQMFFPKRETIYTDMVGVEYRKQARQVAPYIVKNAKAPNIARGGSRAKFYSAPRFGARRVISEEDVSHRLFGEVPNLYNAVNLEERRARLQAQDLAELTRLIENRRGVMASEILQTGKLIMPQYADDGVIVDEDIINFGNDHILSPAISWNNENATIYQDLMSVSERIQENTGTVPNVAICGKNIERYLLANKEIKDWLMVQNRQNLTMASFAPKFTSPQIRYIGTISSLNLDFYSYSQTYLDENGQKKYYVDPDAVIIGNPNGKTVYQPIILMRNGEFKAIAAPIVPQYTYNDENKTTTLSLYSRFLLVPETFEDYVCIKTCG